MFAIAEVTFRRLKEPAFMIMLAFAFVLGISISEAESIASQASGSSLLPHLAGAGIGHPVLTSSLVAFGMAALVAVFVGASEIPRDIDSRMIMLYLAKPIKKGEYVLGKYIGVVTMCGLFFLTIQLTSFVAHYFYTDEWLSFGLMCRQLLLGIAILPLAALSVMFSTYLSDLSAMIVASMYLLFSLSVSVVPILVSMLPPSLRSGVFSYTYIFYYPFPNFLYYFQQFKMFGVVSFSLLFYTLSMTVIFLAIGIARINQRDLT